MGLQCAERFVFDRKPGVSVDDVVDSLTDIWWTAVKA